MNSAHRNPTFLDSNEFKTYLSRRVSLERYIGGYGRYSDSPSDIIKRLNGTSGYTWKSYFGLPSNLEASKFPFMVCADDCLDSKLLFEVGVCSWDSKSDTWKVTFNESSSIRLYTLDDVGR